jgi:hypothetical protein
MHTILILDNDDHLGKLYTASLEAYIGASVIALTDIDKAAEYIFNHNPDLIITRSPIEQRDIGFKFSLLIQKKQLDSKLIIIGKTKLTSEEAVIFDESVEVPEIIRKSAEILGITAKEMAERDVGKFYPIKTNLLAPNLVLVCPVYRRVKDSDEYALFLKKESKLHPEIITILKDENEDFIYIESGDRLKFVNSLTVFLSEMLADDHLSLQDSILFANQGYTVIREATSKISIPPEVVQLTENNIDTMSSIVKRIPKLNELMEMTTNNVNDMFRHSLLVSFIATHVINEMEWGTQEQKIKIIFVSFFHDIALSDDSYVLIHSDEELNLLDLPEDQKINIQRHAINAATMISKFHSKLPFGVDTIIKQHHGARDGVGFSSYPQSISPLALIFMVAEEWVHMYLKSEQQNIKLERHQILQKLRLKYKGFSYDPIFKALENLVI